MAGWIVAFLAAGWLGLGCQGAIGSANPGRLADADGEPAPRSYGQVRPGVVPTVRCAEDAAPLPRPFRRLSGSQMEATLRLAFSGEVHATLQDLPREPQGPRFRTDAVARDLSGLEIEQMAEVAQRIADGLSESSFKWAGCDVQMLDCVESILEPLAQRLFRRPVDPSETNVLRNVVRAMMDAGASAFEGLQAAAETAIQSPQFLYQNAEARPGDIFLEGRALAHELSLLVWNTPADDGLIARVESLSNRDELYELALAMIEDPRAGAFFADFIEDLFAVSRLTAIPDLPRVDEAFVDASRQELRLFASHVFHASSSFASLLTDPTVFPLGPLTEIYGLAESTQAANGGPTRSGILTRAAVLSALSGGTALPSPVIRGAHVRNELLCFELVVPPDLEIPEISTSPELSTREKLAEHRQGPCAGCHALMDPIGFGLEHYDSAGRWRDNEPNGDPVDASGELRATDAEPVAFYGADELGSRLASSQLAMDCFALQLYRSLVARPESDRDSCPIAAVQDRGLHTGGSLQEMVAAFVASRAFTSAVRAEGE